MWENLLKIGLSNLWVSFTMTKKRLFPENSSIQRRSADWASTVSLSALISTMLLKYFLVVRLSCAKFLRSSRMNLMPFPESQSTNMVYWCSMVTSPP